MKCDRRDFLAPITTLHGLSFSDLQGCQLIWYVDAFTLLRLED
jgi:hypothetical protein